LDQVGMVIWGGVVLGIGRVSQPYAVQYMA